MSFLEKLKNFAGGEGFITDDQSRENFNAQGREEFAATRPEPVKQASNTYAEGVKPMAQTADALNTWKPKAKEAQNRDLKGSGAARPSSMKPASLGNIAGQSNLLGGMSPAEQVIKVAMDTPTAINPMSQFLSEKNTPVAAQKKPEMSKFTKDDSGAVKAGKSAAQKYQNNIGKSL